MSIQDRARLIAAYIDADPEQRRLIRDHAVAVDSVTPLGPRLVDELDGLHLPAAA
ncbi:hypothetical protein [Streptomyces echinatus]|uniref:Uncharacterized protein n=1 Tax=Streptomyces echinatus TaxID=67293 RepID=A0A7W9Q2G6_9ACTN|nr:hypothetical protein [Streptomyces echinatus]MBB5932335.1 hypothetical protein [Streptomyces echinatus]